MTRYMQTACVSLHFNVVQAEPCDPDITCAVITGHIHQESIEQIRHIPVDPLVRDIQPEERADFKAAINDSVHYDFKQMVITRRRLSAQVGAQIFRNLPQIRNLIFCVLLEAGKRVDELLEILFK